MNISLTKEQAQLVSYTIERLSQQTNGHEQGYKIQRTCKAILNKLPENIQDWDSDQDFSDKLYWATR